MRLMNSGNNNGSKAHVLEIPIPGKKGGTRRMEFQSEEDMKHWEKAYRKSRWFVPYFFVGVGINLILYKMGLDLGRNLTIGFAVGVGVPILSMFALTELHYRVFYQKK